MKERQTQRAFKALQRKADRIFPNHHSLCHRLIPTIIGGEVWFVCADCGRDAWDGTRHASAERGVENCKSGTHLFLHWSFTFDGPRSRAWEHRRQQFRLSREADGYNQEWRVVRRWYEPSRHRPTVPINETLKGRILLAGRVGEILVRGIQDRIIDEFLEDSASGYVRI